MADSNISHTSPSALTSQFDEKDQSNEVHQSDFELQTIQEMHQMTGRIDDLMLALKDLQSKLDHLQENKTKPTGCGFSCSNNSFTL